MWNIAKTVLLFQDKRAKLSWGDNLNMVLFYAYSSYIIVMQQNIITQEGNSQKNKQKSIQLESANLH